MTEASKLSDRIGNLPAAASFIPTFLKRGNYRPREFFSITIVSNCTAYNRLSDNLTT